MKIILKLPILTFAIFIFLLSSFLFAKNLYAAAPTVSPEWRDENTDAVTVTFTGINFNPVYVCLATDGRCSTGTGDEPHPLEMNVVSNRLSVTVCAEGENKLREGACNPGDFFWAKHYRVWLYQKNSACEGHNICNPSDNVGMADFEINKVFPQPSVTQDASTKDIIFNLKGTRRPVNDTDRNSYDWELFEGTTVVLVDENSWRVYPTSIYDGFQYPKHFTGLAPDSTYTIKYRDSHYGDYNYPDITFSLDAAGILSSVDTGTPGKGGDGANPCSTGPGGECCTALGCIPTTVKGFTGKILSIAIGLAGGIALILMVIGSIRVLISSGDPKAVSGGREMIVAAVAGLLFLIFATLILRFIGINIIGI